MSVGQVVLCTNHAFFGRGDVGFGDGDLDRRQGADFDFLSVEVQQILGTLKATTGNAEFAARGYTETRGASHYMLSYRLDVKTWHGPERSAAVATLAFELVERASRRLVWSGFARADMHVGNTDEERREGLRTVMVEMLKDFPPSQRSG